MRTGTSLFGFIGVQWALQGCWLDDKWRPYLGTAPADMIKPSDRRRRGRVRGAARKGEKHCSGYCCILSPRGNKVLIFRFQKDSLFLAFLRAICVYLLYCKIFHVCKCVVLWVEMPGDMSACVCVDIGPVLVKPGPQTVLCFPNVLGVSACVAIEKVHDVGGIASHLVSDREHLACSLTSETYCFH